MIKGVDHIAISTPDTDRLIAFYRDHLGFEVTHGFEWEDGAEVSDRVLGLADTAARVTMLRLGTLNMEIFEFRHPAGKQAEPRRPVCDHGITHLCLQVDHIEEEYERLRTAGMEFHCPPQDIGDGRLSTYGRDPDGNVVELLQGPLVPPSMGAQ